MVHKIWFFNHYRQPFSVGNKGRDFFLCGISELPSLITILLSLASALIWNSILIFLGMEFGQNWKVADHFLDIYGNIVLILFIVLVIVISIRWFVKKKNKSRVET